MGDLQVVDLQSPKLSPEARHGANARENDDRKGKPASLRLQLTHVEVHSLDDISSTHQMFKARIYATWRIPNGAKDPDLAAEGSVFPKDEHGNPTYRPSAKWYLEQFDFVNAEYNAGSRFLDQKAIVSGNDIELRMRFDGTFRQPMDLSAFPFDDQYLNLQITLHCRDDGPLPVSLEVAEDVVMDIRGDGFNLHYLWELDRTLFAHSSKLRYGKRTFPQMNLSLHVLRRPWFVLKMAALPMSLLSFLSFVQFTFLYEHINDRVTAVLTLVLTAAAVKLSTVSQLPSLSYSTMLDRFMFCCEGIVVFSAIVTGIVSYANRRGVPDSIKVDIERGAFAGQALLFVGVHGYFTIRSLAQHRRTSTGMVKFRPQHALTTERRGNRGIRVPSLEDPGKTVRLPSASGPSSGARAYAAGSPRERYASRRIEAEPPS